MICSTLSSFTRDMVLSIQQALGKRLLYAPRLRSQTLHCCKHNGGCPRTPKQYISSHKGSMAIYIQQLLQQYYTSSLPIQLSDIAVGQLKYEPLVHNSYESTYFHRSLWKKIKMPFGILQKHSVRLKLLILHSVPSQSTQYLLKIGEPVALWFTASRDTTYVSCRGTQIPHPKNQVGCLLKYMVLSGCPIWATKVQITILFCSLIW